MFLFFVLSILITSTTQQNCEFDFEIISDLLPATCNEDKAYYTIENCLPVCKPYPRTGKTKCSTTSPDGPFCIPGYYCQSSTCAPDLNSCAIYHEETIDNTPYQNAIFKPVCDKDGTWMPKQCKGDTLTGRCFCYDKFGKRISGQAWQNQAESMTCACSRRKADLLSEGRWFVGLHCDNMGNYEEMQCDEGHCWCVENQTGKLNSTVVPESAMTRLPCYKASTVGNQYLRQCESLKYANGYIANHFNIHGTDTYLQSVLCDDDGSYGFYTISNGHAYCTWKDGTYIDSYQSDSTVSFDQVNCNCARDSKYFAEIGQALIESCTGSGNYNPFQQIDGRAFCVDEDGYLNSTTIVPATAQDCLAV